jgi:hypothetical protein
VYEWTVDDLCDMLGTTGVSYEREKFLGDVRCDILTRSATGKRSWIDVEVGVFPSFIRSLEKSNERGELARCKGEHVKMRQCELQRCVQQPECVAIVLPLLM